MQQKEKNQEFRIKKMEAQSISYMTTFLRHEFADFCAQVLQRQMGNESRR